jgi:hypothetical protein
VPTSIQYLEDIKGDLVFEGVLSTRGIELLGGNWLKDLGDELYQLRLRILGNDGKARILLRVFLTFISHDEILIISGYCKLRNPGSVNQRFEISRAKLLLKQWKSDSDTMWYST